ncbi:MAG: glycosyltransferase family 4 protein [Gammaproteobacteria bacterium]|jgi:glycosyltransferase involved in cell wall biosynthesis|nr:glycosyltransferase [Gammaproteobacteria bacterium]
MKLKRIAYTVNVFPKFSETFIANEIAELKRRGVEVLILSRRNPVESLRHPVVIDNALETHACYGEKSFLPALKKFRPQLIHAHFATQPTELARMLSSVLDIPFSLTAHCYDIYRRPAADFSERCRHASAVITVSEANARYMVDVLGAPATNLSVIPCGVDTDWFNPKWTRHAKAPLLVCASRLQPHKNIPVLLHACALLRDRGKIFRCVVLGDGDDRAKLEALRDSLGLSDLVQFCGLTSQEEVRGWWREASVGLLPSLAEGMPVSLMEALACAVPVVATAVGGIPEMISSGDNGYVVPVNDPPAMADAVMKILEDPRRASGMGKSARETALARFSLDHQVDRLIDIWQQMLHRRQAA